MTEIDLGKHENDPRQIDEIIKDYENNVITCPHCNIQIDLEHHEYITYQIKQYEKRKQAEAMVDIVRAAYSPDPDGTDDVNNDGRKG